MSTISLWPRSGRLWLAAVTTLGLLACVSATGSPTANAATRDCNRNGFLCLITTDSGLYVGDLTVQVGTPASVGFTTNAGYYHVDVSGPGLNIPSSAERYIEQSAFETHEANFVFRLDRTFSDGAEICARAWLRKNQETNDYRDYAHHCFQIRR